MILSPTASFASRGSRPMGSRIVHRQLGQFGRPAVWDTGTDKAFMKLEVSLPLGHSGFYSRDERQFFSACDGNLHGDFWNAHTGAVIRTLGVTRRLRFGRLFPDGRRSSRRLTTRRLGSGDAKTG